MRPGLLVQGREFRLGEVVDRMWVVIDNLPDIIIVELLLLDE